MTDGNAVLTSPTLLHDLEDSDQREAAWQTFLKHYQPLIYRWSGHTGLNHDDAEEVTARVLCKLVTALRDFVYDPAHRFRIVQRAGHPHTACLQRRERSGSRRAGGTPGVPADRGGDGYWRRATGG